MTVSSLNACRQDNGRLNGQHSHTRPYITPRQAAHTEALTAQTNKKTSYIMTIAATLTLLGLLLMAYRMSL